MIFLTERRGSTFVTPERVHRNYHISMYLLRNVIFHLLPKEKICFQEKNTIFPENTRKIMSQRDPFEKTIFSESLKKRSYFCVFFWERSSFIFHLRCKIIFSGKINMIFPDNTRKIMFQWDFLERPSFQDVWKKKIWFSVQWEDMKGPMQIKRDKCYSLMLLCLKISCINLRTK